jgi:hypothetical protein
VKTYIAILVVICFGLSCFAACPSADFTGDCFVDLADFSDLAGQWLTEGTFVDLGCWHHRIAITHKSIPLCSEYPTNHGNPKSDIVYIIRIE